MAKLAKSTMRYFVFVLLSMLLCLGLCFPAFQASADESKQEFKITGVKGMYFHTTAKHFLIEIEVPNEYGLEVSNSAYAHMETYGEGMILINGTIDLYDLDKQTLVMNATPFRTNVLALYIWPSYSSGEKAFDTIESITFKKGFSMPGNMPETLRNYELKEDMVWTSTQAFSVENTENGATTPFTYEEGTRAVLFYDVLGNVIWTTTVKMGDNVELIDAPVIAGYTFKGWDHNGDNITGTTHIHPIYEAERAVEVKNTMSDSTTAWIIVGIVNGVALIGAFVGLLVYARALKKKNPKE